MTCWIVSIIERYRYPLIFLVLMQLGCGLLVSLQPRYYQQLVSLVITEGGADLWSAGLPLLAYLSGIFVVITLLQGVSGYVGSIFSTSLLQQLQVDFFEKTSQLPLEYFRKNSSGEFFTIFANDIGVAQKFFASLLPGVARELITMLTVVAILLYFCPVSLTLAAFSIVSIVTVFVSYLNRIMAFYAREQRAGWGKIHRIFDETVQGIDTLKALAAEKRRGAEFQSHTGELRSLSTGAGIILSVFSPGIELIAKLGGLGLVVLAFFLISNGELDVDQFLIFFFYSTLLQMSVADLTKSLSTVQNEITGMRRLATFLREPSEDKDALLAGVLPSEPAEITFTGMSFGYPHGRQLYRQADLVIPAKRVTLLQGKSGSGKSTLINLLLRFYENHDGVIRLADIDIRTIPRIELRRKIGVVTQHHYIFQESLRANLLVAQPDATDEEIMAALEQAQLGEFLNRLPEGLETVMTSHGRGMSTGEKQRLCIARLLLRKSTVMILDEPWTNLDFEARDLLAEVINSCKKAATILVLSHESPSMLAVDKNYWLDDESGKFIEKAVKPREVAL